MVFFVGISGVGGAATSIDMPTPADPSIPLEVGDLLILGGHGDVSFAVTDSRMTKFADISARTGQSSLWTGIYDGDPSPITYTADGGGFNRSGARLGAWRAKGITASTSVTGNTLPAAQPQLSAATKAVGVSFLDFGVVDGSVELVDYLNHADVGLSIGKTSIRFHSWEGSVGTTPAGNMSISGTDPAWTVVLLRLNPIPSVAAPCRLIRDDDLGVGGSRIYPPPRSQQRSSRGVGYY